MSKFSFTKPDTYLDRPKSGAPNVKFWKISVQKTICDLEFSKHLLQNFLLGCLS